MSDCLPRAMAGERGKTDTERTQQSISVRDERTNRLRFHRHNNPIKALIVIRYFVVCLQSTSSVAFPTRGGTSYCLSCFFPLTLGLLLLFSSLSPCLPRYPVPFFRLLALLFTIRPTTAGRIKMLVASVVLLVASSTTSQSEQRRLGITS